MHLAERLAYPEATTEVRDRVVEGLRDWVTSEPCRDLLREFRPVYYGDPSMTFSEPPAWSETGAKAAEAVAALDEIDDWRTDDTLWDFRLGNPRQKAVDLELDAPGHARLMDAMRRLGLVTSRPPRTRAGAVPHFDAILVLGGARAAPALRARLAREVIDHGQATCERVVLVGTNRDLAADEALVTDDYAVGAMSEFDLMCAGGAWRFAADPERALREWRFTPDHDLPRGVETKVQIERPDPRESERVLHFPSPDDGPELYAVSAPTEIPGKRANTAATLRYVRTQFNLPDGASLLLATSQIYVPYQQVAGLRALGLPHSMAIDTIGNPTDWQLGKRPANLQKPSNYLQEIRSTFQEVLRIVAPREGDPP